MSIDDVLLSLVNECDNCAIMGERIMCQSAPKEEMRLKCVALAKTALLEIIIGEKPKKIGKNNNPHYKNGFNQCCDEYAEKLTDLFNREV